MNWGEILRTAGIQDPPGRKEAVEAAERQRSEAERIQIEAERSKREEAEVKLVASANRAARTRRRR